MPPSVTFTLPMGFAPLGTLSSVLYTTTFSAGWLGNCSTTSAITFGVVEQPVNMAANKTKHIFFVVLILLYV
jgi:hypothetical protein